MTVNDFIHELTWDQLPEDVRRQARRCLLDTLGAAFGGHQTRLSGIIRDFAASTYGGRGARLWLDGRRVSAPGAALAHGMTIDAFDIHDGYTLTKGHAGAAVVPATLAFLSLENASPAGRELLVTLVVGYEIALRAGRALHATACDYHTSGAWNALGCAAVVARRLGLDGGQTRHALGIAEYHGPRSQMMRCIDHPTMVKDGSGWGAMVGVSSALMAQGGFTGAPAVTVESAESAEFWSGLGERWLICDQYFKPHAVCRWAQPAIEGAIQLRQDHTFSLEEIDRIRVHTFHEATRLACREPDSTEAAQYSLPFPVAMALQYGQVGPHEVREDNLRDPQVLRLSHAVELKEEPALSACFPAERIARVVVELADGTIFDSGEVEAKWGADRPPTDLELREKFRWLAHGILSRERTKLIEEMVWSCNEAADMTGLLDLLSPPPDVDEER